jgi:diguanylate cyclase (GGDEF)-like protein
MLVRAVALLATGLGLFLLAASAAFGLNDVHREQSRKDQRLSAAAKDEAARVEQYFERARSTILLTAHNPAFRSFYRDPGARLAKVRARTKDIRDAEGGLAYIEQLYSSSISEVCFIDRSGGENARFVDGSRAPLASLSKDESKNPFFAPTFALPAGQVYQAKPYVSPDTKTWVISNSTPLPGTGRPAKAIIHFEVSIASFQQQAAALDGGHDVVIIDSGSGRVVVDSRLPQRLGAPLGQPKDNRFTAITSFAAHAGATTITGHRAAFQRLNRNPQNANDWTVVVMDRQPVPSLLSAAGWGPLGMAGAGFALLLVGAFGFRASRRSEEEERRSRAAEQERLTSERAYHETQREFTEVMQITRDESEAYGLLKRHLERSLNGTDVIVLNRNNSHDRLEAMTEVDPASPLRALLQSATPDSCLAVRLGKKHEQGGDREPLLTCDICGNTKGSSTCVPSLVGGEVIGSVLVQHQTVLGTLDGRRIEESMTQASPVLANLRNLALSQARALTDGLTGLPNRRAIEDTLKRMVAQADRAGAPLGVVLFDLDHFKQVNDLYGHEKGDEVLSAVGVTIAGSLRSSDFAGRYGGEEFILLLPGTNTDDAVTVSEKLRLSLSSIEVPGVPRSITASFGVAAMPADGSEPSSLLRTADRALYLAKAGGRDRVATIAPDPSDKTAHTNGASPHVPVVGGPARSAE